MVEGYRGRSFYEQFDAGSQEGNNLGGGTCLPNQGYTPKEEGEDIPADAPKQHPVETNHASIVGVGHPKTDTPQIPCYKKGQLSAEDAFPAGFRNPPPEGSFVFVCPLPFRPLAGMKNIQRLHKLRHGGNDHSPGPNNPSNAK